MRSHLLMLFVVMGCMVSVRAQDEPASKPEVDSTTAESVEDKKGIPAEEPRPPTNSK
jgi:hypothetical protein